MCPNWGSDLSGLRGGEPVCSLGVGQEQRLRLVGGAIVYGVDAAGCALCLGRGRPEARPL